MSLSGLGADSTAFICIWKDVSSISVLTCNANGSYGMEERQRYNGTAQRHNGTAKRQRQNGNGMVETRHKSDGKETDSRLMNASSDGTKGTGKLMT